MRAGFGVRRRRKRRPHLHQQRDRSRFYVHAGNARRTAPAGGTSAGGAANGGTTAGGGDAGGAVGAGGTGERLHRRQRPPPRAAPLAAQAVPPAAQALPAPAAAPPKPPVALPPRLARAAEFASGSQSSQSSAAAFASARKRLGRDGSSTNEEPAYRSIRGRARAGGLPNLANHCTDRYCGRAVLRARRRASPDRIEARWRVGKIPSCLPVFPQSYCRQKNFQGLCLRSLSSSCRSS